jgi:hypothetical protein
VSLGILNFPGHAGTIPSGWAPIFLAEVGTGPWLLIAGIRPGRATAGGAAPAPP